MKPRHMIIAIAALCFYGALNSPWWLSVYVAVKQMTGELGFVGPTELSHLTTLTLATGMLLISKLPAALYERVKRARHSSFASMSLWLATAALLASPALMPELGLAR